MWLLWHNADLDPNTLETVEITLNIKDGAPTVTNEQIESLIQLEAYATGDQLGVERYSVDTIADRRRALDELELVTICVLILKNGFKVVGESACVSRENFNAAKGRELARADAVRKVWALEGYLLKEKVSQGSCWGRI